MYKKRYIRNKTCEFQYKICYSKIRDGAIFTGYKTLFQYKICYSKIKKAKETEKDLDENFNTKFVIAK